MATDPFFSVVPKALAYLYAEGKQGNWGDVRTTSEAALALLTAGESIQSPHLQYANGFLISKFKPEQKGGSWASELWDTALAVRALHGISSNREFTERAFDWIETKKMSDGSYDGEPWDSLFVCQTAILLNKTFDILPALEWLTSLQTNQGAFVSKHYTGLYCQVLGLALQSEVPSKVRYQLQEASIKALQYLWGEYTAKCLWNSSTWTHAYIISGMLALRHPQLFARYDEIMEWYANCQKENGAWDDPVRTAIVLQALIELKIAYDTDRCNHKPVHDLTLDFIARSTREETLRSLQLKTVRAPLTVAKKFLDKDESGNRVITLTPENQMYLAIIGFGISALWGLVINWDVIRPLIFR